MDNTTKTTICKRSLADTLALAVQTDNLPTGPLSVNERLQRPAEQSQADRLGLNQPYDLAAAIAAANRVPVQRRPVVKAEVAPRSGNTGAQSAAQPQKALVTLSPADDTPAWVHEGFLIDWLRFVVVAPDQQAALLSQWRSEPDDWTEQDSGHMGYRRCYRRDGLAIYFDHAQEGRGICFDVSGKGCRFLESEGQIVRRFGWPSLLAVLTNTPGVHITRLDAAIDDKQGLVDLDVVKAATETGALTSRFKSTYAICKRSISDGRSYGTTVNFGSRVSDIMVRMYNKAAEQKQSGHWTRVEVEAKDENAEALAKALSVAHVPGEVVAGVLRNYIQFRDPGKNKQKTRWAVSAWWDTFLGHVEALRLALAKQEPTLERVRAWVDRQVVPSLALLYHAASTSGKMLLADLVQEGDRRLKPKHHALLKRERSRLALVAPAGGPTGF